MKSFFLLIVCCLSPIFFYSQTVQQKLQTAYRSFESDSQLRHAVSSLYVINANTGEVVFDKNSQIGLAPASTQKIITAVTAFEMLGKDYRYETELGYDGKITDGDLNGNLYVIGSGDPTFGSWRYKNTTDTAIFAEFRKALIVNNIKRIDGFMIPLARDWETQLIPDGWIWQDIGNYYGAGASAFNWRENQYDVALKSSDKIGSSVSIVSIAPQLYNVELNSEVKAAEKRSGDNAYIYLPSYANRGVVRGSIPIEEDSFIISGSITNPWRQFAYFFVKDLSKRLPNSKFRVESIEDLNDNALQIRSTDESLPRTPIKNISSHYSPTLDSIIYSFLQKSINLYGEALIKTFAYERKGFGATDSGAVIVRDFWKEKGLDPGELNIKDGSGLSPQNRVTTHAQVEILKYAKRQSWFPYFLSALPEFNHMKMKSGSISDVKGFCGYHTSGDGTQYIFSFLVNNYSGASPAIISRMYKVLDVLK